MTPQNDTCTVYFLQTLGQEFDIADGLKHLFDSLLDFGNIHVFWKSIIIYIDGIYRVFNLKVDRILI
jgi:hypothetical protein